MKKALLALQFHPGDRDKTMRLARFIADLEPEHRKDADFLFMGRFDAAHDPHAVEIISRKFDVWTYNAPSQAVGHPWAPWVTWLSIAEWVHHSIASHILPKYKFVFTFEADCIPISKNWVSDLIEAWEQANAFVVGAETFHWVHSINGNLMYSTDPAFLSWLVKDLGLRGVPPNQAWDNYLFPQFAQWGVAFTHRIWNSQGLPTISQQMYRDTVNRGVSVVHGVKDDSLFNMAYADLHGNR